jgi:Rieske Fe-S protein/polyisoprenoid-binding protein YceI
VRTSTVVKDAVAREPAGLARVVAGAIPADGELVLPIEHGARIRVRREGDAVVAVAQRDAADRGEPVAVDAVDDAVLVREPGQSAREVARLPASAVPASGFVSLPSTPPVAVRRGDAGFVALKTVCTHMGCTLDPGPGGGLVCPCHGAAFDARGRVVAGPATRDLNAYPAKIEGADVLISEPHQADPVLQADHVVVAVDVEAFKRLLDDRMREYETFRAVANLATVPVIVMRLWFPGRGLLGDLTSGAFQGFPFLDNFFVVSNLQRAYADRGETVVEVQAYTVEDALALADDDLLEAALADLRRAFPRLSMAPRKHDILRHPAVFARRDAGSDRYRPGVRTPVANLYLAGDWVERSPATWNMEAAVTTGKLAAAAVVEKAGGIGPELLPLPSGGDLYRLSIASIRVAVRAMRAVSRVATAERRRVRAPAPPPPAWTSSVVFEAVKFRGQPHEQHVTGRFRGVRGRLEVSLSGRELIARGRFRIDLESLDTGTMLRDANVMDVLLDTPRHPVATFVLEAARGEPRIGREIELDCEGELSLRDVRHGLRFTALASLGADGRLCARNKDDIMVSARALGLDLDALRRRCDAVVDDQLRLGFRVALPWTRLPA